MTTLTDAAAILYVAILGQPEDDTLRLAFADALEDAEDHARADFVRVQMELARNDCHHSRGVPPQPWCKQCALRARESALLAAHGNGWRRGEKCGKCAGLGSMHTWNPDDDTAWVYECRKCRGTGYTSPLSRRTKEEVRQARSTPVGCCSRHADQMACNCMEEAIEIGWSRGLIASYSATHSEVFDATGPSEWACEVARAFPIQEIRISDRPAWEGYESKSWFIGGGRGSPDLNSDAYVCAILQARDDGYSYPFPTRELAEHYQARAVAQKVRAKAFEEKR